MKSILGATWHKTQALLDQIAGGLHNSSFRGNWGKGHKKVVKGVQQNRKPHPRCTSAARRFSYEPTTTRWLRNHSGAHPERIRYKPGNEWGRLPEWSSSWSKSLPRSEGTKLWHRKGLWHGDRSNTTDSQPLWHGDRSYRTPRHGESSSERESLGLWHGNRSSQRERVYGHDIVTGATQQIGNCHDLTGVHEERDYDSELGRKQNE